MSRIFDDITKTVGNTPLVRLNRITEGLEGILAGISCGAAPWAVLEVAKGKGNDDIKGFTSVEFRGTLDGPFQHLHLLVFSFRIPTQDVSHRFSHESLRCFDFRDLKMNHAGASYEEVAESRCHFVVNGVPDLRF